MPHVQRSTAPSPRNALGPMRRRRVVGASLAALAARRAVAQGTWPERPVRIVSMLPPGQNTDATVRVIAARYAEVFGHPFVVENRPGAGGTLAAGAVAQATDRHTLGIVLGGPTTTARAINPGLPYDPATAFTAVSLLVRTPFLLVVDPRLGVRSFAEFVEHARARPGRLSYASIGPGTVTHLAMEEMKAAFGLALEHVVYRGFGPAQLDLLAGRVQAMFSTGLMTLPNLRDGSLVALAQTGAARMPQFPDVPTLDEAGWTDASFFGWTGLIAPAGFPPEIAERLAAIAREVLARDPAARSGPEAGGGEIIGSTPAAFARLQAREAARWNAVIARLGLTATD